MNASLAIFSIIIIHNERKKEKASCLTINNGKKKMNKIFRLLMSVWFKAMIFLLDMVYSYIYDR